MGTRGGEAQDTERESLTVILLTTYIYYMVRVRVWIRFPCM